MSNPAGRAHFGVGRGDSALGHLGMAPAPVAELERFVRITRAYLRGEAVPFDDLRTYESCTMCTTATT